MKIVASRFDSVAQPELYRPQGRELHVAISSLSLGGAERIVLDWAARIYPRWRVHLIVLRDREKEWSVPRHVRVTRLHNSNVTITLERMGREIAESPVPVCLCHLFKKEWRDALARAGASVLPVLHNAKDGWPEDASQLNGSPAIITISRSSELELRVGGWEKPISVIRHIPSRVEQDPNARSIFRSAWNIPEHAFVIGMIGAVKYQKNYEFALRVLEQVLQQKKDAYLVIVGGPVNTKEGKPMWDDLVRAVYRLGLRDHVAMVGYVPRAAQCLPAFDVVLNTSWYEGMSIATLETLMARCPIVASAVGGQGEVPSPGLHLLPLDADPSLWAAEILASNKESLSDPAWSDFPSHRLWTLASLAHDTRISNSTGVLFVTANLNSGGAQRSLVNLTTLLVKNVPLAVMAMHTSSVSYFLEQLQVAGVPTQLASERWNAFSMAEAVVSKVSSEGYRTVCFWNVNAKIRLLVVKALQHTGIRFVDVSPGGYGFEEFETTTDFQDLIAYTEREYNARIDALVLKYNGKPREGCECKTHVIRNGVPGSVRPKHEYTLGETARVVVNGRIAPSKFTVEIIRAMRYVWESYPSTELHFFGGVEEEHATYAEEVCAVTGAERDVRVFFHGFDFEVGEKLADFDLFVVLGRHQGCPNALLEALAAGLPAIANADGGTTEQLIHGRTGLLLSTIEPHELAPAICLLLSDRGYAEQLGRAGRSLVQSDFSMDEMVSRYLSLLIQDDRENGEMLQGVSENIESIAA